jgi:hypothetical protein
MSQEKSAEETRRLREACLRTIEAARLRAEAWAHVAQLWLVASIDPRNGDKWSAAADAWDRAEDIGRPEAAEPRSDEGN